MAESKQYAEKINAGWNWLVTGGSSLAATTCARQPSWALGTDPVAAKKKNAARGVIKSESVAFNPKAPGHIPGYTGYIRGADQVAGVRFGVKTRRAMTMSIEELMVDTIIPPKVVESPIRVTSNPKSVASKIEDEPRRIPGYMGFIAGTRDKLGDTFGKTTAQALKESYEYSGYRNHDDQREQRRKTAAGLGKDEEGMFYENNMTLARN